jgi:hypothetical protein
MCHGIFGTKMDKLALCTLSGDIPSLELSHSCTSASGGGRSCAIPPTLQADPPPDLLNHLLAPVDAAAQVDVFQGG